MARTARQKNATGIYHIVLRGVNRQIIFEDDEDKEKFLQTLLKYKDTSGYKIYAYCLMGNHVHILLKEEKEELGIVMRRIGASYVYWYNWKYDRTGHLFQDRYKSEAVENEVYLLTVLRYIHHNPMKAKIVTDISKYKWSSYLEYVGRKKIVDTDVVLGLFCKESKKAIKEFKEFHNTISNEKCLDIEENRRIRDEDAIHIIQESCYIPHCIDIQKFDKDERTQCLKAIKAKGLSTRQIARLIGISRSIVLKA